VLETKVRPTPKATRPAVSPKVFSARFIPLLSLKITKSRLRKLLLFYLRALPVPVVLSLAYQTELARKNG
jgi:hypothetical protein